MYDTATDDISVVSSVSRRPLSQLGPSTHNPLPQQYRRANKAAYPLRPTIQQTASALWNFSTYIRSLTPFAERSTPKPMDPPEPQPQQAQQAQHYVPDNTPTSESVLLTPNSVVQSTSPVPTAICRSDSPELAFQPEQLVRSVPMDIAIAPGSKALEVIQGRQREREVREAMPRSRSRRRIQASRSPSVEANIGKQQQIHHRRPELHSRQVSYDAESSERDGDGEGRGRRGRSRGRPSRCERRQPRGPAAVTPCEPAPPAAVDDEPERGRRRDRGAESRDRSWSAARGRRSRSRTLRAY